jgi:hypothetical protein
MVSPMNQLKLKLFLLYTFSVCHLSYFELHCLYREQHEWQVTLLKFSKVVVLKFSILEGNWHLIESVCYLKLAVEVEED